MVDPASAPARWAMGEYFAEITAQFGFDPSTVFINPGPFYHAAPLRLMMAVLRQGGTVVAFRKFDPAAQETLFFPRLVGG